MSNVIKTSITIDPDNVVLFSSSSSPFSTFYSVSVNIANVEYDTVENYYQACKIFVLLGQQHVWSLKHVKGAIKAKKSAKQLIREHHIPQRIVEEWKAKDGIVAVYHGSYFKFKQNKHLREKLFETGDKFIIHDYQSDRLYSSGCNKQELQKYLEDNKGKKLNASLDLINKNHNFPYICKGKNMLGVILVMVRQRLKNEFPQEWEYIQKSLAPQSVNEESKTEIVDESPKKPPSVDLSA